MIHHKKAGAGVRGEKTKKKFFINLMTIRKWHWMSSAICFACMLLFAVTGITLNHAADIESKATTAKLEGVLPAELRAQIIVAEKQKVFELPAAAATWFKQQKISLTNTIGELNDGDLYLAQTRPGGDAWLNINIESGEYEYESTSRGWIAYFNDLHKGRNTGKAWIYFMDIFAIACVIFSITGFILLQRYADTRAQTWPLVAAGIILPFVLMVFIVH